MNTSRNIALLVVLVLVVGGGYYFYAPTVVAPTIDDLSVETASSTPGEVTSSPSGTTTSSVAPKPQTPELGVGVNQNRVPTKPAPSLTRPITFTGVFAEAQYEAERASITAEMNKRIAILKKDKLNADVWFELASYRKLINDYKGAAEIWEYTKELQPVNYVSYYNLGDLYSYFEQDPVKAEANLLKAISYGRDRIELYRATADFYLTVRKDKTKALEILDQGIAANPKTSAPLKTYRDSL